VQPIALRRRCETAGFRPPLSLVLPCSFVCSGKLSRQWKNRITSQATLLTNALVTDAIKGVRARYFFERKRTTIGAVPDPKHDFFPSGTIHDAHAVLERVPCGATVSSRNRSCHSVNSGPARPLLRTQYLNDPRCGCGAWVRRHLSITPRRSPHRARSHNLVTVPRHVARNSWPSADHSTPTAVMPLVAIRRRPPV